jgi:hypothetical protein
MNDPGQVKYEKPKAKIRQSFTKQKQSSLTPNKQRGERKATAAVFQFPFTNL